MTLRMVAGESFSGSRRESVRAADGLAGLHILLDDFAQHGGGADIEPWREAGRSGLGLPMVHVACLG